METSTESIVDRIETALEAAAAVARRFSSGAVDVSHKRERNDPVTEADNAINGVLQRLLPRGEEAWLSEETRDDLSRLGARDVWIVDPLDGTREFVDGIPEWVISVAFVRDGSPLAGGLFNPATDELFLGSEDAGFTYNGKAAQVTAKTSLSGAVVLASRSEVNRGEWERFRGDSMTIRPMGSVAYKLGLVAAGLADATWTLVPKNEWDIAAGVALIRAAGGMVYSPNGEAPTFNNRSTLHAGLIAHSAGLFDDVAQLLAL